MEFIIAIIFTVFVSGSIFATKTQDDCLKYENKPKACKPAKIYKELGE
jgi:hypothetical protein